MPGTLVQDALEPDLTAGVTLTAAGTSTGTAVAVDYPLECAAVVETGAVTGTSPTMDVVLEASDDSSFASGVVSVAAFPQIGDEDSVVRLMDVYIPKRYVRAKVTVGGTSPSYAGTVITLRQEHYHRTPASTA